LAGLPSDSSVLAHPPRLQTPPLLLHPGCFSAKKVHPYRNKPARPRQAMPASAIFWPYQEKQPQRTSWCFFYEHHLKLGENIWGPRSISNVCWPSTFCSLEDHYKFWVNHTVTINFSLSPWKLSTVNYQRANRIQ
jgi:hypothetical protein